MESQNGSLTAGRNACLPKLPTELIRRVADFLPVLKDIASLRLACRDLYAKTYDSFGDAAFETITLNLSPPSIEWLGVLARYETFSKCVKGILIHPAQMQLVETWETSPFFYSWFPNLQWSRDASGCIIPNVPVIRSLCTLLKTHFTRCTSFAVHVYRDPVDPDGSYMTTTDAATIMLHVIETANIPVRSFTLVGEGSLVPLRPDLLNIGPYELGSAKSTWAQSIKELRISYRLARGRQHETAMALCRLIRHVASLETLYLRLENCSGKSTHLSKIVCNAAANWPLCKIILCSGTFSEKHMIKLLRTMRNSLETLVLERKCLIGTWQRVFEAVKDELIALRSVTIITVLQWVEESPSTISFCHLANRPSLPHPYSGRFELVQRSWNQQRASIGALRYKGVYMSVALYLIASNAYFPSKDDANREISPSSQVTQRLDEFDLEEHHHSRPFKYYT